MASFNYDKAVKELREILDDIQQPDSSLEELSKKLKRAKKLVEACKTKLRKIEADVQESLEDD